MSNSITILPDGQAFENGSAQLQDEGMDSAYIAVRQQGNSLSTQVVAGSGEQFHAGNNYIDVESGQQVPLIGGASANGEPLVRIGHMDMLVSQAIRSGLIVRENQTVTASNTRTNEHAVQRESDIRENMPLQLITQNHLENGVGPEEGIGQALSDYIVNQLGGSDEVVAQHAERALAINDVNNMGEYLNGAGVPHAVQNMAAMSAFRAYVSEGEKMGVTHAQLESFGQTAVSDVSFARATLRYSLYGDASGLKALARRAGGK